MEKWLFSQKNYKDFLELAQDNFSHLKKEVKNSFDYFEVNKEERIEKIYLTGGLAAVGGLEDIFKASLEVDVAVLDNMPDFNIFPSDKKFNSFKNSFSAVLGLVL